MTDENAAPEENAAQNENAPKASFGLQRIYVKDISFEAPNGALVDTSNWQPKVAQDLNTQITQVQEGVFEVVLSLTINVKLADDKTAFLIEVHQAGLFAIAGLEGPQLQHMLSSSCPQILFPYAREAIDNLAVRGGFPPLALPPLNFDALYAQAMAQAKQQAEAASEASETH